MTNREKFCIVFIVLQFVAGGAILALRDFGYLDTAIFIIVISNSLTNAIAVIALADSEDKE